METMRPLLAQARAVENPRCPAAPPTQHATSTMDMRESGTGAFLASAFSEFNDVFSDLDFAQHDQPLELRHLLAVFRLEHLYQTFEENEVKQ